MRAIHVLLFAIDNAQSPAIDDDAAIEATSLSYIQEWSTRTRKPAVASSTQMGAMQLEQYKRQGGEYRATYRTRLA